MSFEGRTMVVVGATGGIGSSLARLLSVAGCRLALVARDGIRLAALAGELSAAAYPCDVTRSEEVDRCMGDIEGALGRIEGVAHCVGSLLLKPAHTTTDADWDAAIATNLTTSFYVLRAAVRTLIRGGGGSIVLVSSAVADRGMIHHEAIAAAKAGVVGLAKSAAATYARNQIRVNCVAPGLTRTPMTESLIRTESSAKVSAALHPLGRIGEPQEVARAIQWLLSPEQSWVTGQVLGVDGGLSSVQPRPTSVG